MGDPLRSELLDNQLLRQGQRHQHLRRGLAGQGTQRPVGLLLVLLPLLQQPQAVTMVLWSWQVMSNLLGMCTCLVLLLHTDQPCNETNASCMLRQ